MRRETGAISTARPQRARCRHRALAALLWIAAAGCASPPEPDPDAAVSEQLDRAEAALAVGELDAALESFRELTEAHPAQLRERDPRERHLRAWQGLALSRAALGDDLGALAAFRQLDALTEGELPADLSRARCAAALRIADGAPRRTLSERSSELGEALRVLEGPGFLVCPEEQRRVAALRVHLAFASGALRKDESLRHYRLALEFEPGHEVASLELARLALADGDADEGIRVLAAALEANPRSRALVEAAVAALTGTTRSDAHPSSAD